ncbi:phosphotransferase [Nocardioides sp. LHD-245]|uniref:phosphotransferase n=1 Tax=Nocardioides sp. LHD-245 TaxID=3051387 RepID=UPI0027E0B093|nr:phosphotransferase [Nocardioides sp. LHD-245]
MTQIASATTPLPLSLDEVTPAWLTGALASSFPGIEVTEVRRDREFFGTAASARLHLSYAPGGPVGPASVHVKGGFDDTWRKRVWMALQQEVRFYNEIAPEVALNIPTVYFAATDDAPQGILVLEDLLARGVTFGQNMLPVTADHVANVLEAIAPMHAAWWGSPRLARLAGWEQPQRTFLKYCFRPSHWDVLVDWANGDLLVEAIGSAQNALTALDRLWGWCDAQPHTFVHGDPHGGNLFYEADGRPGILDWQLCFAGTYSHDMAWIIVTSLDVDQRREHERDLVQTYRDALRAAGGPAPELDEMWTSYRRQMAHAIASYGALPRDNGPAPVMEEAGKRVFTAAIDHDLLGVWGLR